MIRLFGRSAVATASVLWLGAGLSWGQPTELIIRNGTIVTADGSTVGMC